MTDMGVQCESRNGFCNEAASQFDLTFVDMSCDRNNCTPVDQGKPFVFITNGSLTDYYDAFRRGATFVLRKPLDREELRSIVLSLNNIQTAAM